MNNKKTDVTSFRLEKEMLSEMRKIAEMEKISLNTLVSQVFDQYLNWSYVAPKGNMVPLPKSLLIKILDKITNDEITGISNYMVETEVKSIMMITRNEYTFDSFMKGLEYWTKMSNFPSSIVEKPEGVQQFIIQHEMGKKWSLYYKQVFEKMFEQVGVKSPKIDTTDHTLIMTLTRPKS